MTDLRRNLVLLASSALLASACGGDKNASVATTTESVTVTQSPAATSVDSAAPTSTATSAIPATTQSATAASTSHTDTSASNASPDGARILTRTAAKYRTVNSMRANFTMRVENPLLRSSATTRGQLFQKRPDRIALKFTDPAGDVIVSDGTYFWVYTPSSMPGQVLRTDAAAGAKTVDLQAQFVGDPVKRFSYTMQGSEVVGGHTADVLTLTPRESAPYRSMKVWIDRDDSLVRRFQFVEQSGVIRTVELANMQMNSAVNPSIFHFTVPSGVRVVSQ